MALLSDADVGFGQQPQKAAPVAAPKGGLFSDADVGFTQTQAKPNPILDKAKHAGAVMAGSTAGLFDFATSIPGMLIGSMADVEARFRSMAHGEGAKAQ